MESRLLNTWIEELKVERKAYYQEKKALYDRLTVLSRWVYDTTKEVVDRIRDREIKLTNWNYDLRKIHAEAADELAALGIKYEKEHFTKTCNNGSNYTVMFDDVELLSHYEYRTPRGFKETTYGIISYYFVKYESKSLYNLLNTDKDLNKLAEKEVDNYVEALIERVEKRYGKILMVSDSYLSNMVRVSFECEKGKCYLERIVAGGYNIQVLHNRILVKSY